MSLFGQSAAYSVFALSVQAEWDEFRTRHPDDDDVGFSMDSQKRLQEFLAKTAEGQGRYRAASSPLRHALVVRLFLGDQVLFECLRTKCVERAATIDIPNEMPALGFMNHDECYRDFDHAGERIEVRMQQAAAETLDMPSAPASDILVRGVNELLAMFEKWPNNRTEGKRMVMVGVMAALLARRLDLADRLLRIRKTQPQYVKSFSLFKRIVRKAKPVTVNEELFYKVDDPIMHADFFELFNPLRVPSRSARPATGVEEGRYAGRSIIEMYYYAWLYLLYFADSPKCQADWLTLREIMIS